jgi:hypothetical protein
MNHDADTELLFDLITRMLEYEPYKRMTLREVREPRVQISPDR